ncbi:hypothetical protein GCM10014719_02870 [Planomonospora parontospora subsp. antibiotica]|nr:hypothetical protein GCM10014719_02870 [Planomonospora parontospora subsp. antibiotica]GII13446.1 hypothetical protein Ppa05_01720 [Planomonospora parontospora subsp. antibiotica]
MQQAAAVRGDHGEAVLRERAAVDEDPGGAAGDGQAAAGGAGAAGDGPAERSRRTLEQDFHPERVARRGG